MSSMNWTRLTTETKGTVLFARASEGRYQITLNKGDRVRVHAKKDGWLLVELDSPQESSPTTSTTITSPRIAPSTGSVSSVANRFGGTMNSSQLSSPSTTNVARPPLPSRVGRSNNSSSSNLTTVTPKVKNPTIGLYPEVLVQLDGPSSSSVSTTNPTSTMKKRQLPTFQQAVEFSESPLAKEILQVIREWSSELIKLRNENMMEEYHAVKKQMAILVGLRKKITDFNFQKDADDQQKEEINQRVIKVIEEGSRKLNLDLIVRVNDGTQKGQRANENNTTVIDLFNQYLDVQEKEDYQKRKRKVREELKQLNNNLGSQITPEAKEKKENDLLLKLDDNFPVQDVTQRIRLRHELPIGNIHLLVNVEACMFTFGEDAEIYFSLYNYTEKRYITEDFAFNVTPMGMPKDIRLINNSKTIFADVPESQYLQELYLVVKIYRKGKMLFDMKANTKKVGLTSSSSGGVQSQMMGMQANSDDVEEETAYRRPFCCTLMPITPEVITENLLNEQEFQPGTLVLYTTTKEDLFARMPEFIIEGQGPIERIPQDKAIGIGISLRLFNKPLTKVLEENKDTLSLTDHVCLTKCLDLPSTVHPTEERNDLYISTLRGKFLETRNVKLHARIISTTSKNAMYCIDRNTCLHKTPFANFHSSIIYHALNPNWNEMFRVSESPETLLNSVLVLYLSNSTAKKKQLTEKFGVCFCNFKDDVGMITKGENDGTGIVHLPVYKYVKDMEKTILDYVQNPSKLAITKDVVAIKIKLTSTIMTQDATLDTFIRWDTKQYPIRLILENFDKLSLNAVAPYVKIVCDTLFNILTKKNDEETSKFVFNTVISLSNKLAQPENAQYLKMFNAYVDECFKFPEPIIHKSFLDCLISNLENFDEDAAKETSEQDAQQDKEKSQTTIVKETLLGLPFVLSIITKNRNNYEAEKSKISSKALSSNEFFKLLKDLFDKVGKVVSLTSCQKLYEAQDIFLKLISPFFTRITEEFASVGIENVAKLVKDFIEAIPNTGRLSTLEGKLGLIRELGSSGLIKSRTTRTSILTLILNQVEKQKVVSNSLSRRVISAILADLLATIQKGLIQRTESYMDVKKDISVILSKLPYIQVVFNELNRESKETEQKISRFGKRDDLESFQEHREYERIQQTRAQLFSVVLCIFYLTDIDMITQYFQREFTEEENAYMVQLKDQAIQEMMEDNKEGTIKRKVMLPSEEEFKVRAKTKRIRDTFELLESMIDDSPIPEYWIAFNVFGFHTSMKTIQIFSEYLQKHHVKSFDPKLWNRLFDLYYRFALSPRLQIEKFSLSKQTKFNAQGDLRVDCVILFRKVFEGLSTDNQYYFVPDMVDRVLRLAASIPKQEIYVQTLNIYYNILKLEFQSEKKLQHTQGLTAAVFDEFIVNDKLVDDKFKEFFVEVLDERFEKDEILKTEGKQFMNQTKRFMELVASVKRFTDDQEDQKTSALLRVMQYVATTHQEEIYFKYIHMLAKVHENNQNYVEAGMALLKHAEKLSFNEKKMLPLLSADYPEEPEFRRKEKLYHQAMKYFDLGKDWERSIKLSRELSPIYETKTFEYKKLAELMRSQGEWFQKIFDQKRFYASYFFVGYYGKGFEPYGLQNKEYIYRGNEAERLVDFTDRITKRFPNAEMLKPLEDAPEEKKQAEGQYIRIITVYPSNYKEIQNKCTTITREMSVSKNITSYESFNDIKLFKLGKTYRGHPEDKKMNEIRDLFTDFTFLIIDSNESTNSHQQQLPQPVMLPRLSISMTPPPRASVSYASTTTLDKDENVEIEMTGDSFPTIVRRKPIISRRKIILDPIENAVKNIEDKNIDLNELVLNHMVDTKPDTKQLSMSLNGTIDAAVHGGINKYISAFFVPDWIQANEKHLPTVKKLQKALDAQLEVLERGLEMYRKFGSAQTKAHVDHLCVMHQNMKEQLAETLSFDYGTYLTAEYKKQQQEKN